MAIVLYNILDKKHEQQLTEICCDIGCHTRKLTNENLGTQFGRLAGVAYKTPVKAVPDPAKDVKIPAMYTLPECILFAGLSDEVLDEFLAAYKAAGLKKISKKAVLTPSNCSWSLYGLLMEIEKEEQAFNKLKQE